VNKKVVNWFLWIYLILSGLVFIFLLPPFQKYDETPHFTRAVALSQGQFFCKNNQLTVPLDLGELHRQFNFQKVLLDNEKFPINTIDISKVRGSYKNVSEQVGGCNLNFLGYIPNTIGVILGVATDRPILIFYFGRIFGFIFFLILFILSLKIINPKFKYLLWFYALTPLVVHQVTAFSYDVVIFSLIPVLFALFVNLLQNKKLSLFSWVAVWSIITVIGLIKIVYYPLILLFLLTDFYNLETVKAKAVYILKSIVLLSLTAVIVFGVTRLGTAVSTYTPYVNPTIQKKLILKDPIYFLSALKNTIVSNWFDDYKSTVAVYGWKNSFPSTDLVYYLYFLGIVWVIQKTSKNLSPKFNPLLSVFRLLIIIGIIFSIYLAMYLTWSVVGESTVKGVQGRYYLPFLPFILIILSELWLYLKNKYILRNIFLALILALTLFTSAMGLYLKYFDYSKNYTNFKTLDLTISKITKKDKLNWQLIDKNTTFIVSTTGNMISGFKINFDNRGKAILIPYKFKVMDSTCQKTLRSGYLRQYDLQADNIYLENFATISVVGNKLCLELTPYTFDLSGYTNSFVSVKTLKSQPLLDWLAVSQ